MSLPTSPLRPGPICAPAMSSRVLDPFERAVQLAIFARERRRDARITSYGARAWQWHAQARRAEEKVRRIADAILADIPDERSPRPT